jgi:hypothetical protein
VSAKIETAPEVLPGSGSCEEISFILHVEVLGAELFAASEFGIF